MLLRGRTPAVSRVRLESEAETSERGSKDESVPDVLASFKRHRHLRGDIVFKDDGAMLIKGRPSILFGAHDRAGLRRIGWHVILHTFASDLVMHKAPIKVVQE
jgi:site-specific recombinase XerD